MYRRIGIVFVLFIILFLGYSFVVVFKDVLFYIRDYQIFCKGERVEVRVKGYFDDLVMFRTGVTVVTDDGLEYDVAVPDGDIFLYNLGAECALYVYNESLALRPL